MENKVKGSTERFVQDDLKPRKWLLVVLIVIAIVIVVVLLSKFISDREDKKGNGIFDLFGGIDIDISETFSDADKEMFNSTFEHNLGTKSSFWVEDLIDDIVTNNKTKKDHLITVKFGDITTKEANEIKNIKTNLNSKEFEEYEVSAEYDEDGYINEISIEGIKKVVDPEDFNRTLEFKAGTSMGTAVGWILDDVITSNKTNKDLLIRVKYGSIDTTDENQIRNIKKSLDQWTNYEVILDYNEDGYVNVVTIQG